MSRRDHESLTLGLKVLVGFLTIHLLILLSQTWAVFDYDFIASLKLQEPRVLADEAVVQSNRAIGVADTVVMVPLSIMAIVGILRREFYGVICTWILLGTAMYWPVVFVASRFTYASADIRCVPLRGEDLGICVIVFMFASWGSWLLCRSPKLLLWWKEDFPEGSIRLLAEETPLVSDSNKQ